MFALVRDARRWRQLYRENPPPTKPSPAVPPTRHMLLFLEDAEEGRGGDDAAGNGYDYDDDGEDRNMDGQEYGFVMFDPVWGKPDYPPGHHTTACQVNDVVVVGVVVLLLLHLVVVVVVLVVAIVIVVGSGCRSKCACLSGVVRDITFSVFLCVSRLLEAARFGVFVQYLPPLVPCLLQTLALLPLTFLSLLLLQFCGVLCCPCLMGRDGWRGTRNRNVWRRIRKRAAVITSGVDIVAFLLSVILNGGFQVREKCGRDHDA